MVTTEVALSGVLSVSLLVFFAKILAGLFSKIHIPAVLGELSAGIIFGPNALGSLIVISGQKLIELNDVVLLFAETGAILILFTAGLEMTFAEFAGAGVKSFVVGASGVIVPFVSGFYVTLLLGHGLPSALIVAATLTATSIAITLKVFEEMGKTNDPDAKLMINAAVVDDVLGLAVLAIVTSVIQAGTIPSLLDVTAEIVKIIVLWLVLLITLVALIPRFVKLLPSWKAEGTDEAAATVLCFGSASVAALLGLSPIVGAYAAGMGLAGSRSLLKVKEYIAKINLIFAPVFFATIGASLNIFALNPTVLLFFLVIAAVAVFGKIIGCGVPAGLLSPGRSSWWKVGVGMTSRGEVGLIIAGIGLTSGIIQQDVYAALVAVIILTSVISPILLRRAYGKEAKSE
jgi:Kef-type K+ transport system membrane component KefB